MIPAFLYCGKSHEHLPSTLNETFPFEGKFVTVVGPSPSSTSNGNHKLCAEKELGLHRVVATKNHTNYTESHHLILSAHKGGSSSVVPESCVEEVGVRFWYRVGAMIRGRSRSLVFVAMMITQQLRYRRKIGLVVGSRRRESPFIAQFVLLPRWCPVLQKTRVVNI